MLDVFRSTQQGAYRDIKDNNNNKKKTKLLLIRMMIRKIDQSHCQSN